MTGRVARTRSTAPEVAAGPTGRQPSLCPADWIGPAAPERRVDHAFGRADAQDGPDASSHRDWLLLRLRPESVDSESCDLPGAVTDRAPVGLARAGHALTTLAARTGVPVLDGDTDIEEFADAATLVRHHDGEPASGGDGDLVKARPASRIGGQGDEHRLESGLLVAKLLQTVRQLARERRESPWGDVEAEELHRHPADRHFGTLT
jgi:hypothetical protein